MLKTKGIRWSQIAPTTVLAVLAAILEVSVDLSLQSMTFFGFTSLITVFSGLSLLLGLDLMLQKMGANQNIPKRYVVELLVVHSRGESLKGQFHYNHQWLASFAARYLAYMLDHFGDVNWEFGIRYRAYPNPILTAVAA